MNALHIPRARRKFDPLMALVWVGVPICGALAWYWLFRLVWWLAWR